MKPSILLLFQYKNKNVEFGDILKIIFKEIGKVESSYTSKLLHTINPNKPIWDKFVLMNLGLKQNTNSKDKINYSINTYSKIESFHFQFLSNDYAKKCIEFFDINFPEGKMISNVKKIDFLLWSSREDQGDASAKRNTKLTVKLKLKEEVVNYLNNIDDKGSFIEGLIEDYIKSKNKQLIDSFSFYFDIHTGC